MIDTDELAHLGVVVAPTPDEDASGTPASGAPGPVDALPLAVRQRLRAELRRRKWSQAHFARLIGSSESRLAAALSGSGGVRLGRAQRMAQVLGWTASELFADAGTGEAPPPPAPQPVEPEPLSLDVSQRNAELREPAGTAGAPSWPVFLWGTRADPLDAWAVEARRDAPPAAQWSKVGPRGYAVEVATEANAYWGGGIHRGDLAWVNPERPHGAHTTVAALVETSTQRGEHGLVVGELAPDPAGAPALWFHPDPDVAPVLAARPGAFRVVGRVVYIDRGFTPV